MLAPSKGYPEPWDHRPERLYPPYASTRLRPFMALVIAVLSIVWTAVLVAPVAMKAGEARVDMHRFFDNLHR